MDEEYLDRGRSNDGSTREDPVIVGKKPPVKQRGRHRIDTDNHESGTMSCSTTVGEKNFKPGLKGHHVTD